MSASLRSWMSSAVGAILEKKITRQVKYGFGRGDLCSYATRFLRIVTVLSLIQSVGTLKRSGDALIFLLRFCILLLSTTTTKLLWNKSSKCLGFSATTVTVSESKSSPPPPLLPNSTCLKNCIASFFKQFSDSLTRTSSPVQISRRSDTFESTCLKALYPVGEGAGYAGGIVSAAVDGMHAGFALAKNLGLYEGNLDSVLGKAQNVGVVKY
nr:isoform A [Ipomoea batatas]